ncbi:MAG: 2-isopropylmalate synthase [Clostridiales bacterium]|nr:2-isopropylmalate synthase [Clostridiales bacterium]
MRQIKIFDTTLRDGEQSPGCSMNLEEKIRVALRLQKLRVDIIEAGFACSSPGDFQSVQTIANTIKNCSVASLARCVPADIDAAWNALKGAVAPRIHVFLATSPTHMQYKLKMTEEQVLERAINMVQYAKKYCSDIEFSAEDAMRSDRDFLRRVTEAVIKAGATVVNIPDTVGYTTPDEMYAMIDYLLNNAEGAAKIDLAVHCHNDLGQATANSLAGVRAGANQIECTINGLGERAGNAPLEEVVMGIKTRPDAYNAYTNIDTTRIYKSSALVYNIIGQMVPINKPIIGKNAFAHESGIHQHGVLAHRETYEIMTPESVGIRKNTMVLGKHSGRHGFEARLKELGYELTKEDIDRYFEEFKKLCDKKKEVTDRDIEALVTQIDISESIYSLASFDVHTGNLATSTAVMRLNKNGDSFEEVALGDGPIDAAYRAIDKIVGAPPHRLENYVIQSVSEGKETLGKVMVKLSCEDEHGMKRAFNGHGLSTDIIEASILAYINAMNKLLGDL